LPPLTFKQKRSKALKEKYEQLDFEQPFTQRERKGLGKSNMAFIRGIQISRRISKDEAIALYETSNLKGKKVLKNLMEETKGKLTAYYSQKHKFQEVSDKDFEAPVRNAQKRRLAQDEKIFKAWLRKEKKELRFYLASVKNRNSTAYERIKRGHKTYPDATKYELYNGINSHKSKLYRLKHGLEPEYTGKVVKNAKSK
jgi:hypothetical protein